MTFLNISDTALWIAAYRSLESARPDALFQDKLAEKLAGSRGLQMVNESWLPRQMTWSLAVRTRLIDQMIEYEIQENGVNCVVNLACGLDTRPYRLDSLNSSIRWVEVDLPEMMEYKSSMLHEHEAKCILHRVTADLSNADERKRVLEQALLKVERALVITEGFLCYVPTDAVATLASELREYPAVKGWATDLFSSELLEISKKTWASDLAYAKAGLYFGPKEGTGFFESRGWRTDRNFSLLEESEKLGRDFPLSFLGRPLLSVLPKRVNHLLNDAYRLVLLR